MITCCCFVVLRNPKNSQVYLLQMKDMITTEITEMDKGSSSASVLGTAALRSFTANFTHLDCAIFALSSLKNSLRSVKLNGDHR